MADKKRFIKLGLLQSCLSFNQAFIGFAIDSKRVDAKE